MEQKCGGLGTEWWGVIEGHPNYSVSNLGRVRSEARWLSNRIGVRRFWGSRILVPGFGGSGYLCIVLDRKNCWVHKLVARAFIPNLGRKRCVNHIDGNKTNNRMGNLEWVTHQENMDALMRSIGEDELVGNMKLTRRQVCDIQERVGNESDVDLAAEFGVCGETVRILRRSVGIHLSSGASGSRNGNVKLNDDKVVEIRRRQKQGVGIADLAEAYGVGRGSILDVLRRRTWRHVK